MKVYVIKWSATGKILCIYSDHCGALRAAEEANRERRSWFVRLINILIGKKPEWVVQTFKLRY